MTNNNRFGLVIGRCHIVGVTDGYHEIRAGYQTPVHVDILVHGRHPPPTAHRDGRYEEEQQQEGGNADQDPREFVQASW